MSDADVLAVLNPESGTLKTADPDFIARLLVDSFAETGRTLRCEFFRSGQFPDFLERSIVNSRAKTIVVAGGDGTVSAAARLCIANKRTLGILPAGTMNLFARSLNIPLDLETAVRALARGKEGRCDLGRANGRPFVHQFSVGLQPKVIQERDRTTPHGSRFSKLLAGLRAIILVVRRPPVFKVAVEKDGKRLEKKVSFIAVSNNLFGDGHLPYADKVDDGVLGLYSAGRLTSRENLKLIADLTLGTWSANPHFKVDTATSVTLRFPHRKRSSKAVIDGEIIPLDDTVEIENMPGALSVLHPGPLPEA